MPQVSRTRTSVAASQNVPETALLTGKRTAYPLALAFLPCSRENKPKAGAASRLAESGPGQYKGCQGYRRNVGGQWNNGVGAGLFCASLYHAACIAGTNIGCRLAKRTRNRFAHGQADSVPFGADIPSLFQGKQPKSGAASRLAESGPGQYKGGRDIGVTSAVTGVTALALAFSAPI